MRHGFSIFAVLFITIVLIFGTSDIYALETDLEDSWKISDTVDAKLYKNETENKYNLVITGEGAVQNYASLSYKSDIVSIRFEPGISTVSRTFLEDFTSLEHIIIDGVDTVLPAYADGLLFGTVFISSHMANTAARTFAEISDNPFISICEYNSSVCSVCNYTCLHTDGASAATCTAGSVCNTCHSMLSSPAEHNYIFESGYEATCEEEGKLPHYKCSGCNHIFDLSKNPITDISISPKGHALGEIRTGFASNCTVAGQIDYYECSVCLTRFDSEKNKVLIISLPFGSHSGGTATCTEKAKCEVCSAAYGELNPNLHTLYYEYDGVGHRQVCQCGYVTENTSHTFTEEVVSPPTEAVGGTLRKSCECGYYEDSEIPPLDNTKDSADNGKFNFPLFFGILIPSLFLVSAALVFFIKYRKNH